MKTKTKDSIVQPYLFFNGRCEEALKFYKQTLGAEVDMLMRFKDAPEGGCGGPGTPPPGEAVMHASFRVGGTTLMASDGCCDSKHSFQSFALSLSVPDEAEADRRFAALAKGGQVQVPLGKTFFAPRFGMVTDRFGMLWMILVPAEETVAPGRLEAVAH